MAGRLAAPPPVGAADPPSLQLAPRICCSPCPPLAAVGRRGSTYKGGASVGGAEAKAVAVSGAATRFGEPLAASSFLGLCLPPALPASVRQPSADARMSHPHCLLEAMRPRPAAANKWKGNSSSGGSELPEAVKEEAHKYFDQVNITVRAGYGGNGAVLKMPRTNVPGKRPGRTDQKAKKPMRPLKRGSNGSVLLPNGGHGADVIITADETMDTLLDLHRKARYHAHRGGNVDNMEGLTRWSTDGLSPPALRILVPVGTVVKRKRNGKVLSDLTNHGDEVLVARGGRGGLSVLEIPQSNRAHLRPGNVHRDSVHIADADDKKLTYGLPGEEIGLELTLRVVADVGLVGLPNAGKSSLLAAVTAAKPEIAAYPFTTLMPNLGRVRGAGDAMDGGFANGATLADLPGLIEGASGGKGLGKMFLRHLRHTKLMVHLLDASTIDPMSDYRILREELRLYNPEYTARPHIVVLNKIDLPQAAQQVEDLMRRLQPAEQEDKSLEEEIQRSTFLPPEDTSIATQEHDSLTSDRLLPREKDDWAARSLGSAQKLLDVTGGGRPLPGDGDMDPKEVGGKESSPCAVVAISAKEGMGIEELLHQIHLALRNDESRNKRRPDSSSSKPLLIKEAQWQI
eukprot:SM000173S03033  [mRNA]  locus=s173:206864:210480:- [translate_table: standard]